MRSDQQPASGLHLKGGLNEICQLCIAPGGLETTSSQRCGTAAAVCTSVEARMTPVRNASFLRLHLFFDSLAEDARVGPVPNFC